MDTPIVYKNVIKFEHAQRGAYGDLSYQPVFRASAIFFAMAPLFSTAKPT